MTTTIIERFAERVDEHPDRTALRFRSSGAWQDITWREYGERVERTGRALLASGFQPGDKIALLSSNRPEWHVVDVACMSVGGATAAIYSTSSPEQAAYIASHSEAAIVFVDTAEQLDKILKMRDELKHVKKVVVFDDVDGSTGSDFVQSLEDFVAEGDQVSSERFITARDAIQPDSLATFVYTSGTTGPPKAVMLTHANIWWTCVNAERHIPIGDTENGRALSYLPLSHIAERMISHLLQIYYGTQTWFAESLETLLVDLKECKPTYFFGVPRVWEKFYSGIQARLQDADPNDRKTKLARKALEVGRSVSELEQEAVQNGKNLSAANIPLALKLQHRVLDKLVLAKLREALGMDACELAVSSAAPLNKDVIWFFHSTGIKICEGYGQSEGNGPTTWNPPDAVKIGSVGTAFGEAEVRLAEDGEILVRGGNVMAGYFKDKEATDEVIDADGWMHTGDIGTLDDHGYLEITDRKKDLIITAGGKNIAPQEIENRLRFHNLISQVVVIGDRRPYLSALVTLSEEEVVAWASDAGIEGELSDIAKHERTVEEVRAAISELNRSLAKVEGIKRFRVLDRDFIETEGEITPTMKVKRRTINDRFAPVIEEMYSPDAPDAAAISAP